MNGRLSASGGGGAGFAFFGMGALRWDGRDARTCIENFFTLFAHLDRFRHGERNMEVSSRGLSSCSRNMHGTSPVASGRNTGAHSALFARSCGGI